MAFATWQDVQGRLGRTLTPEETAQVEEWILDLEADIRARIPDVDSLMSDPEAGASYSRTVKRVVAETIVAKLRNPNGLRQSTVSIDDYSRTETIDSTNSSGRLQITDDDWELLVPAVAGDAFTIRIGGKYAAGSWPS
ncbi:Gp19/Gp15/Gp42 family protein [Glutamicibacter sp. AOP5-A2-7]